MIPKLCVTPVCTGDKPDTDYVTVEEACEILQLHRSQTRVLLGAPDRVWQSAVGQIQYVFDVERVYQIKRAREERRKLKEAELNQKECYFCHCKCKKEEMRGGICFDCQARKIVRNFACNGDCGKNCFNIARLKMLAKAIAELDKDNVPE